MNLTDGVIGGVAICIRSKMCSLLITFARSIEATGTTFEHKGRFLIAISIYKPPKTPINLDGFSQFLNDENTLVGGDWNYKHPDWRSRRSKLHKKRLYQLTTFTKGAST